MGALAVVLLLALASGGAQHARAQRGSDVSAASEQAASASSDQAASTGGTDSTADGIPADSAELEAARGRALGELGTDLGAADAETRTLAFDALRSLSVTRVDEVEARLRELRLTDEPPSAAAYNTLQDIRHHLGSQRADDSVDLARGARQLLGGARAPSRTLVQVAERMALLRGLEAMDSLAADRVMIGFFQRGWSVWQWEARHLVARRGLSMLAALIEARSAGNPEVRRWAVGSIRRLGVDSVGAAVQMASIEDLPDVLRAYASLSDLNAMPAVITFVDHPDPAVRAASREATASYERNAIWQLRLAHRNKLGENADLGWSWQITMQRLFDALDARRLAPANELLDEGLAAAESQSWADMHDRYERALRREPLLPRRSEMGPGYAGEALALLDGLEAGDEEGLRRALGLLRRAVRLAPEHPAAAEWRATVAFHEAERSRRAGVLDEGAYQEVLAVQPGHTAARAVLADIEEGGVGEVEASGVSLAARLLALVGVLLLLPYGLIAGGARRGWAALTPKLAQVRIAAVRYAASKRSVAAAQGGVHAQSGVPADPAPVGVPAHAAPVGVPADAADPAPVGVPAFAAPAGVPADAAPVGVPADADPAPVGVPADAAPVGVPADAAPVGVPADAAPVGVPAFAAPVGVPAHAAPVGVPAFLASAGWMGVLLRACGRVFKGGFASVWRGFRRVGFFGLALYRRVRPARAQALDAPSAPGRLQRMRKRAGAAVGARAPGVGALLDRARGGVETLRERRAARARRPRPSLRELGETLAMMSRSEPPPAPRASVAHSARPAAHADDVHTADVSALPVVTHAVVDADAPVAAEHDLDDLLFGDSDPGCGGDDSGDESFDTGDSACETAPGLPEELLVTLARLANDTSPGLLEAPDTLPG